MKHIMIIGFWLLSQGVLTAQLATPSLRKGPRFIRPKSAVNLGFSLAGYFEKGGGLLYRGDFGALASSNMIMFSLFDENMQSSDEQRFTVTYDNKLVKVLEIFTREDRICIIGSIADKKTQTLIMQEVDPEDFEVITSHEIISIPGESTGFDFKFRWDLYLPFSLAVSTNHSTFAYAASYEDTKAKSTHFFLGTFSNEGKLIWSYDTTLSTKDVNWQGIRMDVSNNADLVFDLFEESFVSGTKKRKPAGNYRQLWIFQDEGKTRHQYRVEPSEHRLKPFVFKLKPKGELICVGLYEDKEENLEGIIRFTFSPELSKPEIIKTDLLRSQYRAEWASRTQSNGISLTHLSCDRIILRRDGGLILLSYFGKNAPAIETYALAGDMIVCSMDSDGNIEWNQRVETKAFKVANLWHTPFHISVQKDRIWIVFNNARENANDKYYYLHRFKESRVEAASISLNGEVSRLNLSSDPQSSSFIYPYTRAHIEQDRMLLVGGTARDLELWEIKF